MNKRTPAGMPMADRIAAMSEPEPNSGCWLWAGSVDACGYGRIKAYGRWALAHRESYTALAGEIPKGLLLRHKCDTPSCVNPDHLEPGTDLDNANDAFKRGRSKVRRFSDADRHDIFTRVHGGESAGSVARMFNADTSSVMRIYRVLCKRGGHTETPRPRQSGKQFDVGGETLEAKDIVRITGRSRWYVYSRLQVGMSASEILQAASK